MAYDQVHAIVNHEIDAHVEARQQTLEDMKSRMDMLMKEVSTLSRQIQVAQEQRQIELNSHQPFATSKSTNLPALEASTSSASSPPIQGDGTLDIKATKQHTTTFAKNLPRVAQIDARSAEATMIREQKQKQELFNRIHTKYPECRTTVFEPSEWSHLSSKDTQQLLAKQPTTELELEFVHGYHNTYVKENNFSVSTSAHENDSMDCCSTNNLFMLSTGELVYYTAGVVIMYDEHSHTQRFFIPSSSSLSSGSAAEVSSLAVHPNKSIVASGYSGREAMIHVWDSQDVDTTLATLAGHTQSIRCLDFSHDGKLLVSLGGDVYNSIRVWKWRTSSLLTQARGHSSQVYSVRFNPFQAMGIPDKEPKPGQALYEDQACYTLVSCGARHIRFWTLRKQPNEKSKLESEDTAFFGSTFGSPSRPKMKRRATQQQMWKLEGNHPSMLEKGEQMQDFTCFTFVDDSAPLYIFDPSARKVKRTDATDHSFGRIVAGTAKGDIYIFWQPRKCVTGSRQARGTDDGELKQRVRWWEVPDDDMEFEQFQWEPTARLLLMIPHNIATGNKFKLDAGTLAQIEELTVKIKAKPNSKSLRMQRKELEYKGILGHNGAVVRMCYNVDSDILLSSGVDGSIMAWQLVMHAPPSVPGVNVLGKYTPLAHRLDDGQHEFNQIAGSDGNPVEYHFESSEHVRSLSWTYDSVLLGMNSNSIYRIDMSDCITHAPRLDPRLVVQSPTTAQMFLDVHPSTERYAVASADHALSLWSITSRHCVATTQLPARGTALAFSPDGSCIAIGTCQAEVLVIDATKCHDGLLPIQARKALVVAATASAKKTSGAVHGITDIKFSPNGLYLALGARDNCIHVLDAERGYKKLYTCYGHANFVTHLDWARDSSVFQTNSGDGELLYWDASSGKQLTDTMSMRDVQWETWTGNLGWPVQGIWKKRSGAEVNLHEISSVCKTRGMKACGQSYEAVATAELRDIHLFRWPCLRKAKGSTYRGHSSPITGVRFSCLDSHLISIGGSDASIFQWKHVDRETQHLIRLSKEEFSEINKYSCVYENPAAKEIVLPTDRPLQRRKTEKATIDVRVNMNPTPPLENGRISPPRSRQMARRLKGAEDGENGGSAPVQVEEKQQQQENESVYPTTTTEVGYEGEEPSDETTQDEATVAYAEEQTLAKATEDAYELAPAAAAAEAAAPETTMQYEAMYDFDAENEDELSFHAGDILVVTEQNGDWWVGSRPDGTTGAFPANYVQEY